MEDIFLSTNLDERRVLCISTLSRKTYRETVVSGLGGDSGYFVYEVDLQNPQAGIEVIGKAASVDGAMKLYDLISMAHSNIPEALQYKQQSSED